MHRLVPLLGIAVFAACSDSLPVELNRAPSPRLGAVASSPERRHAVLFKSAAPRNFSAQVSALGGTLEMLHERAGIAIVSGLSTQGATALGRNAAIDAIAEDFTLQLTRTEKPAVKTATLTVGDVSAASQSNPATGVFYPYQWHMGAIGAPTAWANGILGSSNVTVAILDSGIDYLNPDLNGLVDIGRSVSFVPSDNVFINAFFPGRHPVSDLNGHGTFVGSLVSSKAIGNAGVTSRVTLMGVKVFGRTGQGSFQAIIDGILHATDNGADVINMSLGVEPFPRNEEGAKDAEKFVDRLTKYARAAGVTVVVASGNDGLLLEPNSKGLVAIFCSSKNVICVTATGPLSAGPDDIGPFLPHLDVWAAYSTHGKQVVDVAAPGGNGTATSSAAVWGSCSRTLLIAVQGGFAAPCLNPLSIFTLPGIGTSAAAPHVAGLAALLVEQHGRNPGAIEAAIQNSSDDFGKPGIDDQFGHGRVNVAKALGL